MYGIEAYLRWCFSSPLKRASRAGYYTAILNEDKYSITNTWNVLRQAINKQKHLRKLLHTFIINGERSLTHNIILAKRLTIILLE